MSSKRIKGNVTVGSKSFRFHFHDFANLSTTRDHYIVSPKFTCYGHQWQLRVFPGGTNAAEEGQVSIYLHHPSREAITVSYDLNVIDKFGETLSDTELTKNVFTGIDSWGSNNFISRSDILDDAENILDDNGTLTIVVSMEEVEELTIFVPKNPFANILEEMFNDETTADICFEVSGLGETEEDDGNKRVKTTTPFYGHRLILQKRAPMIAAISNDGGGVVTAPVNDIKPRIFKHLLSYVYGGRISRDELKANAKDIIDAADKYSIVNLKLAAEAAYVKSTEISFDNAMDNLLYADSRNLALLKEAVMNFLAENHFEAAAHITFTDFPAHVVKDLLIAVGRKSKKDATDGTNVEDVELTTLSVSELRRKLHKMGKEVDGSREAMIESIKSHSGAALD